MNRLTAQDVMSAPVACVQVDDPIAKAARLLTDRRISGAPVLDVEGRLVGIVTEGDILRKEAGVGARTLLSYVVPAQRREIEEDWRRAAGRTVGDIMTRDVFTVAPDARLHEVAALMARNEINRVPVCRNGDVVGIVTRNDVLRVFSRPDDELCSEVRDTILKDLWVDPDALEVAARDGVIVLRGAVPRASDAQLIETFVAMIDGVVGVDVSGLTHQHPD